MAIPSPIVGLFDSGAVGMRPETLLPMCGARATSQPAVRGTEYNVTSAQEFIDIVDAVNAPTNPGDTITFAAGTYDLGTVQCRDRNVNGLLIMPSPGATVTFTGSSKINCYGADVEWYGFRVIDLTMASGSFLALRGDGTGTANRNKVWGFYFNDLNGTSSPTSIGIDIRADDCEIYDNTYEDVGYVTMNGTVTQPPDSAAKWPLRIHYHHNTVRRGKDEVLLKWIGIGGGVWEDWNPPYSGWQLYATVEYNLVEDWIGNAEIFGLKSSNNICRFNYFKDCGSSGGRMNVREGWDNEFYGNCAVGTDGTAHKFAFAVQGKRNKFMGNWVDGDNNVPTAFSLSTDEGDENEPGGRNNPAEANDIRFNILNDFAWNYTPGSGGKTPLNQVAFDNIIATNYWGGPIPPYNESTTGISEATMRAANPGIEY